MLLIRCPVCEGSGSIDGDTCPTCLGAGGVYRSEPWPRVPWLLIATAASAAVVLVVGWKVLL